MAILVTGGTGLVGSHLLLQLCQHSKSNIKATYRSIEKIKDVESLFNGECQSALFKKIEWLKVDLKDQVSIKDVFIGIDEVYHTAALVSFKSRDYDDLMKTNAEATALLVNLSLENKIRKFCYVSSVATLGTYPDGRCTDEEALWQRTSTTSAYSISKFYGENEVWRAAEEGLNTVIVNPGTILGSGNWNQSSLKIIKRVSDGLLFYPSGSNGFVGVKDVVRVMINLMNSEIQNERFILVSDNIAFKSLFEKIAVALKKKSPKYLLKKKWAYLFLRMEQFRAFFGGNPVVTSSSLNAAYNDKCYSSDKIKSTFNFQFETLDKVIEEAADESLII